MAEITIMNDYLDEEPILGSSSSSGLLKGKLTKIGDMIKFQVQKTCKESGPGIFLEGDLRNLRNLESMVESRMSRIEKRLSYNSSVSMQRSSTQLNYLSDTCTTHTTSFMNKRKLNQTSGVSKSLIFKSPSHVCKKKPKDSVELSIYGTDNSPSIFSVS